MPKVQDPMNGYANFAAITQKYAFTWGGAGPYPPPLLPVQSVAAGLQLTQKPGHIFANNVDKFVFNVDRFGWGLPSPYYYVPGDVFSVEFKRTSGANSTFVVDTDAFVQMRIRCAAYLNAGTPTFGFNFVLSTGSDFGRTVPIGSTATFNAATRVWTVNSGSAIGGFDFSTWTKLVITCDANGGFVFKLIDMELVPGRVLCQCTVTNVAPASYVDGMGFTLVADNGNYFGSTINTLVDIVTVLRNLFIGVTAPAFNGLIRPAKRFPIRANFRQSLLGEPEPERFVGRAAAIHGGHLRLEDVYAAINYDSAGREPIEY